MIGGHKHEGAFLHHARNLLTIFPRFFCRFIVHSRNFVQENIRVMLMFGRTAVAPSDLLCVEAYLQSARGTLLSIALQILPRIKTVSILDPNVPFVTKLHWLYCPKCLYFQFTLLFSSLAA